MNDISSKCRATYLKKGDDGYNRKPAVAGILGFNTASE
jgi:hypothetical protein